MTRTPLAALALLALASGSALAADMALKAPPPAPVYSWSGCYVGANVGYGWQSNGWYDPSAAASAGSDTGSGIVGGGQLGCDHQVGAWVLGIEGMFDGTGVNGSHLYPGSGTETLGTNTHWFATETARIGYTISPQALLYFKGGAAEANFRYTDVDPSVTAYSPYSGSANATRFGGTIGGGVEYAFAPNWSVFAEYDYMDFGTHTTTLTYTAPNPANATPYTYNETNSLQTILVGVNYKFGSGPIVAKY